MVSTILLYIGGLLFLCACFGCGFMIRLSVMAFIDCVTRRLYLDVIIAMACIVLFSGLFLVCCAGVFGFITGNL